MFHCFWHWASTLSFCPGRILTETGTASLVIPILAMNWSLIMCKYPYCVYSSPLLVYTSVARSIASGRGKRVNNRSCLSVKSLPVPCRGIWATSLSKSARPSLCRPHLAKLRCLTRALVCAFCDFPADGPNRLEVGGWFEEIGRRGSCVWTVAGWLMWLWGWYECATTFETLFKALTGWAWTFEGIYLYSRTARLYSA
jgi:hypothetical protein